MDENRLIDIETRLAFQEDAIERLSDVLYRQQELLDRLAARCDLLGTKVTELAEKLPDEVGGNEKPPHY